MKTCFKEMQRRIIMNVFNKNIPGKVMKIIFFIIINIASFVSVFAQTKTGTTIGQFLLIEPDARISAMGNTGVTSYDNLMSAYYNPGALGKIANSEISFSHCPWLADISYDYAGAVIKLSADKSLSLNITSLNSGDIDVRTVENPLGTGEKYSVNDMAISLGYGQRISEKFSAGVKISYIQETIWHSSLSTVALDFGTIYQIAPDGLRIGASISNYGFPAKYAGTDIRIRYDLDPAKYGDNSALPGEVYTEEFYLPVMFRVGLGFPLNINSIHKLFFAVDAFHPSDNNESISFGAEYIFMDILSIRAGYQNLFLKDSEVGLTLGSGLQYELSNYILHFDYSWAKFGRLGNTQRFTLGFQF
jgi:hypothetical protein